MCLVALALFGPAIEAAARAGVHWFVVRPAGSGATQRAVAHGGGLDWDEVQTGFESGDASGWSVVSP